MDADRHLTILNSGAANLVSERPVFGAEASEHPMMAIPFTAEIDGRQYRGDGLSLTKADVIGLLDPQLDSATRLVQFLFSFDGFTVSISIDCLVSAIGVQGSRATLTFRDPAGLHLPQLRHMLNSYIAGDMVTLGQTLVVSPTQAGQGPRNKLDRPAGWRAVLGRVFGSLMLVMLTLVLVGAVARIAYSRLFALHVPTAAHVTQVGQTMGAVVAGQIDYVNLDAAEGEVAFSIRSVSGQSISIAMPCDCEARLVGPGLGATILAGDPVLSLFEPGAALALGTMVSREYLFDLAAADHVRAVFADGTAIEAQVDPESLTLAAGSAARDDVAVRLIPEAALTPDRQGQLAELTIIRKTPSFLSPVFDFVERTGF